jgi:predicted XRE-type DNA-binding protein
MRKEKREAADDHSVTHTSYDVFVDLGIKLSDADRLKLHIAMAINSAIQKRKLTQVEAAKILKIDQPKVSAILRGRLDGFSEDRLMGFLFTLGRDMEVRFPERQSSERGQLKVRA